MDDHPGAGGGIAVTGFQETTDRYEQWLATHLTIVTADLDKKHAAMKAGIFPFLRATFYRWAELWGEVCPELAGAPELLAVGDLHVENFGTWRDAEGRLVWGINDFDETCRMPYAVDLVRLASSAHLAIDIDRLKLDHADACRFLLKGYQDGLEAGGRPWVLGSGHPWLLTMAGPGLKDPAVFWAKLHGLESYRGKVPKQVRRVLQTTLPGGPRKFKIAHRIAGLGSLGRQRFVALSDYKGDYVCREAKALAPSAWNWAVGRAEGGIRYQKALDLAVRDPDPCVSQQKSWILRRLAPDCSRVDMALFPRLRDEKRLLQAMGWETANLHVGSGRARQILADLKHRPATWLHRAATAMTAATREDWRAYSSTRGKPKPARQVQN